MKASISITLEIEIEADDRAAIAKAETEIGGRLHFIFADGIEEATVSHWDYTFGPTTYNTSEGVSLVEGGS